MSSIPPRPKPWEQHGASQTGNSNAIASTSTAGPSAFDTAITSSSTAPQLPDRPAGLDGSALTSQGYGAGTSYASGLQNYTPRYGGSYGMSSYGGMGGLGYNRLGGGYGSAYGGGYGGYGGYGTGYGSTSYGSGYGMGGYGVGGMGGPGEAYNLTSSLQATTAPAFAILESLVTAFTSLAQLVESTYMATHSSFFAMVGVADQLGSLKTYLGQVLGVFSILRLGRRIARWLKGKKVDTSGWANEWSGGNGAFGTRPGEPAGSAGRPSAKPLILFLLSAIGLPYLMSRLVRLLIENTRRQQIEQEQKANLVSGNTIDPSKLVFARAKWEFKGNEEYELSLGRDEIVAILEMRDGKEGTGWWRGRTRDGRMGWFPGNYVEIIKRRDEA